MQQIIQGAKSLSAVPALLKQRSVQNLLLVSGRHLTTEESFRQFTQNLDLPFHLVHSPEGLLQIGEIPTIEAMDTVIAIGGGKTLDFAKSIIHRSGKPPFFVAVPTTAGSGSEATPFAVLYSGKEKVSIDGSHLLPQTVVLDASLLKSLPLQQKAISGADAFAQCVESVWNVHSNQSSESYALEGIGLLWKSLHRFVNSGDEKLAGELLQAAHLSGKAIAHTRTTGPHALSYYLTAYHSVPHGQAVALFLPLFFHYNNQPTVAAQMEKICAVLRVKNAEEAFEASRSFFRTLGLATNFSELGPATVNVDELVASVNQQRFANNPVPFDEAALKVLIQRYLL